MAKFIVTYEDTIEADTLEEAHQELFKELTSCLEFNNIEAFEFYESENLYKIQLRKTIDWYEKNGEE